MRYNFDTKRDGIDTTVLPMPDYVGRLGESIPSRSGTVTQRISDIGKDNLRVRGITSTQDDQNFSPDGLMGSQIYDEPTTLDASEMTNWARRTTPVESEPDVTDWMVSAKAAVATLKARSNEYGRAGSMMNVAAGDPFTPGVTNGQMSFRSERGTAISDRGSAQIKLATNDIEEISVPGSSSIVRPDFLGWAAGTEILERQWTGSLMSIEELTANPSSPIGFTNIGGETAPMFLGHVPSRPSILNRVSMGIQSDQKQTLGIKLRDSGNYTRVLNSFNIDVPKGTSTVNFRTLSLSLSPMVAEIQPQNGTQTVLTDYSVAP